MADDSVQQRPIRYQVPNNRHRLGGNRSCTIVNESLVWQRMAVAADAPVPPPRSGAASVVVKGKLYIYGGYGGGTGRLDDFWSWDFERNIWEEVTTISHEKPGCRENNGVVLSDSNRTIYLFGGYNGTYNDDKFTSVTSKF
jgi:N-acetylneuraminic acid mutarotase